MRSLGCRVACYGGRFMPVDDQGATPPFLCMKSNGAG